MGAALLIPFISGGIDLVIKIIKAYKELPDSDVEIAKRLDELSMRLEQTNAEVQAVLIKDV